ncbi:MAG: 50S ribosomal protein L25 [Candidatus Omnitrophica bacterium]|nr:50S ribosomal protein L25 [Candidatus Omnitrophota bacterium]
MEKIILKAQPREASGKGPCRQIRNSGQIPAVVYKDGKAGFNVQVDNKDLWRALHTTAGENAIITMNLSGEGKASTKTVIVKEVQIDPVNDKVLHVDFQEISLTERLKVNVPIVLKGEAIGVKENDGVLAQVLWELQVECLPTEIPAHIEVHVDSLHIGQLISVKELQVPAGVKVVEDPEQVVVTVNPPAKEEAVAAAVEGAPAAEEPELIKKGKKEEEEEGAEEGKEAEKTEKPSKPGKPEKE